MKFSLTNRMSVAARVAQEFYEAMKLSTDWAKSLNIEFVTEDQEFKVNIEFPYLPKPNCLRFSIYKCADGWRPVDKKPIIFSLPNRTGLTCPLESLTWGENNFFFHFLTTRCGHETMGFERM